MPEPTRVRRALLAVYDKTGIVELAQQLSVLGIALVSSGGTAKTMMDAGIKVTPVEEVTGFPEMLGGRVKTLHPFIHAAILADRRQQSHVDQLAAAGIEPFDLVVVNLYPFRETVASGAGFEEVIEKIDIGGPAMVRAAAKNFESVGVVVDPARYGIVWRLEQWRVAEGGQTRLWLAEGQFAPPRLHYRSRDPLVVSRVGKRRARCPATSGSAFEKVQDQVCRESTPATQPR